MNRVFLRGPGAHFVSYLFQTLLITYLLLLLVEQIWTGVVSVYLNLNYFLIAVILAGVLDVFSEHPERMPTHIHVRDYIFMGLLGILGFAIIKYKTAELGWLSWMLSLIAGALIVLLSLLVLDEHDGRESHMPRYDPPFTGRFK